MLNSSWFIRLAANHRTTARRVLGSVLCALALAATCGLAGAASESLPANTELPAITGATTQGQTLSASDGSWTNSPTSYAYQWERCDASCNPIPGATANTYVPVAADVSTKIRVSVTATNSYGSTSATSSQTATAVTKLSFAPRSDFSVGAGPDSVAIGDFNADGIKDMAVANSTSNNVSVLLGEGAGSFGAATNFNAGSKPFSVAIGDFNSDGKQDLAVANERSANVSVLLGSGTGSFGAATNYSAGATTRSVAIGDFNGDGTQDLVAANTNSNNVSVLLNTGTGSFRAATNFAAGTKPFSVVVGDFDRDGNQDLATANAGSNNVSVLLGTGTGSFGAAANLSVGGYPSSVAVGDFNGDGKQDLATGNPGTNNVSVLLGTGTGSFGAVANFRAGKFARSVAVGDFNGDGEQDFAVANAVSNDVSVLLGTGTGSFGAATNFAVGSTPWWVAAGDLNGDGSDDLAVANNGIDANSVSVLLNTTVVIGLPPANTELPVITGAATQGQTLSASHGSWSNSPTSYAYQWQRCDSAGSNCSDIPGATDAAYTLVLSDVGSTIHVTATASNSSGQASATSARTNVVDGLAPANTELPQITGATAQGQALVASNGFWTNSPESFAYQWQRCDSWGGSCSDIPGVASDTYTLVLSDTGSTIRVTVTAYNSSGSASATSAQTSVVDGVAPVNTELPLISGQATQGLTLSASIGSWANAPRSYAYQWQRCDSSGSSCLDISGATSDTYTLVLADAGSTIRVVVTASNSSGQASATSAQTDLVIGLAPVNIELPAISGQAAWDQTLSASSGLWTNSPTDYAYQWQRCDSSGSSCSDISGATSDTYTLVLLDLGSTIRVVVTASNSSGSASATSALTNVVEGQAPANTEVPVITGTATQGQILSASNGSWTNSPTAYAYQWQRCDSAGGNCSDIPGASANTHVLAAADVWMTIRVSVTATNKYGSASATSNQTPTVASSVPANTERPVITGQATQGQTLSASSGSWSNSPTSYAYQWWRCDLSGGNCLDIPGETSPAYTLGLADIGSTIRVYVAASNSSGSSSAVSDQTEIVSGIVLPPVNTAVPAISGTARQGQALSASSGLWTNSPTAYAYQWQRCDSYGSNCSGVPGATSATYTLVYADAGSTIRVVVTASNESGPASATSAQTDVVAGLPPASSSRPVIGGAAIQSLVLSASTGSWSNSPTSYAYQWERCDTSCAPIPGATSAMYTMVAADVSMKIGVSVTATNPYGSTTAASRQTAAVVVPTPGIPGPPSSPVKLVFIHHSTGAGFLSDTKGALGAALRNNNYYVSDTYYGWGAPATGGLTIGDLTDTGNWWNWFRSANRDIYLNDLYNEFERWPATPYTQMPYDPAPERENEIIMFKSCFPNSHISGNPDDPANTSGINPLRGQPYSVKNAPIMNVANVKGIYNDILEYFATRPDKLFVLIVSPPLREADTTQAEADNARAVANWLVNDWLDGYTLPNVAVFDYYNVLTSNGGSASANDIGAESGNHHRWLNGGIQHVTGTASNFLAYPTTDSHPSAAGQQKATAEFVPLLNYWYHRWANDASE